MRELLEELVATWPKGSPFRVQMREDGLWFYGFEGTARINPIWKPERFDYDAAAARTIIEEELRNLGCYRLDCIWDDEGTRIYAFILERFYQAVAPTRTEALLKVAIEAFREAQS